MPITYNKGRAVLDGRCPAEDADGLLEWLRATEEPVVDLAACDDLHTAIIQLLLASRTRLVAPRDAVLANCLAAAGAPLLVPDAPGTRKQRSPTTNRRSRRDPPSPDAQVPT